MQVDKSPNILYPSIKIFGRLSGGAVCVQNALVPDTGGTTTDREAVYLVSSEAHSLSEEDR